MGEKGNLYPFAFQKLISRDEEAGNQGENEKINK